MSSVRYLHCLVVNAPSSLELDRASMQWNASRAPAQVLDSGRPLR